MKISYKWLKKYISTDKTAEEISEILTAIGLEVEGLEKIETIKGGLEGLVIGQVLTCEKHPDADKLNVTTVDYGQGATQIVCGAPNVAVGQKVVVATCGSTLYPTESSEPFKIKKSKIRGVESFGMLCAEDEIGVGVSHDGIIVLPQDVVVGSSARDYYGVEDDYLIEIGLTPNRVDAASHLGVARDLAAYLSLQQEKVVKVNLPSVEDFGIDNNLRPIELVVENSESAPRYLCISISGIEVKPSPEWMQNSLRAIGINPKNNVVDITNFILHELGQPLHAFDADKIEGDKIVVKNCEEGTPFTTLDGVERKLSSDDLMICSAEKPMCLAGVFGGEDSGVTDSTTSVVIESAYFNPVSIRKSAKRHGLSTDASFRYERGTDPMILEYAIKRAAILIKELAGGTISSNIIEQSVKVESNFDVELSVSRTHMLIGKEIGKDTIVKILKGLEIEIAEDKGDLLSLRVPSYRVDVKRDVDVIEDILRIYGYNNIEIPSEVRSTLTYESKFSRSNMADVISNMLSAQGFNEIMSNSLTKASYYEENMDYPLDNCVKIINPLSIDLNVMRQTLLYNSMEALILNSNRRRSNVKLYEVGNCYFFNGAKREECEAGSLAPYSEKNMIAMLISGETTPQSWMSPGETSSFFSLKHYAEKLLKRVGLSWESGVVEPLNKSIYSDGISLKIRNKAVLEMGVVSRGVKELFGVKNDVYFLEMDFDTLISICKTNKVAVKELSKFPEVRRDLALLVDNSVTFQELRSVAMKCEKKLLKNVSLFDVYQGDKLEKGKKSYALSFILEDTTQTLNDVIIDKTMSNLVKQFEKMCGAQVRK